MASERITPHPQPLSPEWRAEQSDYFATTAAPPASPARRAAFLGLLAIVYAGLNAAKPLHIDDTAYAYYSAQAAAPPPDPYRFQILWSYEPQPANEVMAPPV